MLKFKDKDKIVFFGDSVTDTDRKRPIGDGLWNGVGTGYVRTIDTMLNVYYPELRIHTINMGNSGDTTRDLLARVKTDVVDLKPDYVVMCIGFNDVWRFYDSPTIFEDQVPAEEYRANLQKLIDEIKPCCKELTMMTPYFMEPNREDQMRKTMDEYRTIFKEVCKENNLVCIDLQDEFDEYLKYRYSACITLDRVHPGYIGAMIIARRFLKEVGFDRPLI